MKQTNFEDNWPTLIRVPAKVVIIASYLAFYIFMFYFGLALLAGFGGDSGNQTDRLPGYDDLAHP